MMGFYLTRGRRRPKALTLLMFMRLTSCLRNGWSHSPPLFGLFLGNFLHCQRWSINLLLIPAKNRELSLIASWQTSIWDLCNFAWILFLLLCYTTLHPNLTVAMKLTVTKGIEPTRFSSTSCVIVRKCSVYTLDMASIVKSRLVLINWCLTFLPHPWEVCNKGTLSLVSRIVVHCMYEILRS